MGTSVWKGLVAGGCIGWALAYLIGPTLNYGEVWFVVSVGVGLVLPWRKIFHVGKARDRRLVGEATLRRSFTR